MQRCRLPISSTTRRRSPPRREPRSRGSNRSGSATKPPSARTATPPRARLSSSPRARRGCRKPPGYQRRGEPVRPGGAGRAGGRRQPTPRTGARCSAGRVRAWSSAATEGAADAGAAEPATAGSATASSTTGAQAAATAPAASQLGAATVTRDSPESTGSIQGSLKGRPRSTILGDLTRRIGRRWSGTTTKRGITTPGRRNSKPNWDPGTRNTMPRRMRICTCRIGPSRHPRFPITRIREYRRVRGST
jgi:hypothetical protein